MLTNMPTNLDPATSRAASTMAALATQTASSSTNAEQAKASARKTAVEFEGVFLGLMLKEMFSGVQSESEFTGGFGEEMFRDMLSEQYAQTIADTGGIGLADSIYREVLALQEISE